jgi:hypothetical protein
MPGMMPESHIQMMMEKLRGLQQLAPLVASRAVA